MFFNSVDEIQPIASRVGCAIFVLPDNEDFSINNAFIMSPEKSNISIEQVRDMLGFLSVKQTSDRFVIIRPAELLGAEASNALLKNLEEPKDKVHFVLITASPSKLLPTILSRSQVYFLKTKPSADNDIDADENDKILAKKFITARPADLPALADAMPKDRSHALKVISVAIEMLYKSYYITKKDVFIRKLPNFLALYEAIEKNGHIKLHVVADLL
ncbi:hypothetical protein IJS18_00095 [Candidatus Saccharibacteria bacterium]|nr:hypothetical protein [Candidatus Saccharibacteria bacterium]